MALRAQSVDELRRELRRLSDKELDAELKAIHKGLAEDVLKVAERNVPVRTGRLRASLRAAGTMRDAIGRVGSKSVPYAAAVHWKYGPPFLTDAAAAVEDELEDRYDRAVSDLLDRIIGR